MSKSALAFFAATAQLCAPALWGQHAPPISTNAVVEPLTTAPITDTITGTETMIVNRSRVLKNRVDGEGKRYFAVRDSDLAGLTPAEVARRLVPVPLTPQQRVKTMDVVVDVEHPLFLTTTGKDPFAIGTTIIDGKVEGLQVNTDITLGELKIMNKN